LGEVGTAFSTVPIAIGTGEAKIYVNSLIIARLTIPGYYKKKRLLTALVDGKREKINSLQK